MIVWLLEVRYGLKCLNCGNEVVDGEKYCPKCGATILPGYDYDHHTSPLTR
jgi:uncharacterized OB-fold protein